MTKQGRPQDDRGAAAVEFALVLPILILVVFGILQYGLYFSDSLDTRQGVREAARQGVVRNFDGDQPSCTAGADDMVNLRCSARKQISALTGTEYVKVVFPTAVAPATTGWVRAAPLVVCALVKSEGGVGLLPMPNDGWIKSTTQMSIEQAATPVPTGGTSSDPLPDDAPAYPC